MPDCSIRMNRGVCISQDRAGEVRRAEYRPVLGVVIHGCQEQRLETYGHWTDDANQLRMDVYYFLKQD